MLCGFMLVHLVDIHYLPFYYLLSWATCNYIRLSVIGLAVITDRRLPLGPAQC